MRPENHRLKVETIAAYGGFCTCCGERRVEFLTLDHIAGDGAEDRRQTINKNGARSSGRPWYAWLKRHGYPQGRLQVLCFNCNFAKHVYGECPHGTGLAEG